MNESASKHPELYELMSHLLEAGMSIEQTIVSGFTFAEKFVWEQEMLDVPAYIHKVMLEAARMLHVVADELHISRAYQQQRYEQEVARIQKERWEAKVIPL